MRGTNLALSKHFRVQGAAMLFKRLTITVLLFAGIAIVAGVFADSRQEDSVMKNYRVAQQSKPMKVTP